MNSTQVMRDIGFDDESIDFSVDPDMYQKLDVKKVKMGQEQNQFDQQKIYHFQMEKDIRKIQSVRGPYEIRNKKFIEVRESDPDYRKIAIPPTLGDHGNFSELLPHTAEESWKSTSKPYGRIAHLKYLEYLANLPKGPSDEFIHDKVQRALDKELLEDLVTGKLNYTKAELKQMEQEKLDAIRKQIEEDEADMEELKKRREERIRFEYIKSNQFEALRTLPVRREFEGSLKRWHKGIHYPYDWDKGFPYVKAETLKGSSLNRDSNEFSKMKKDKEYSSKRYMKGNKGVEKEYNNYMVGVNLDKADKYMKMRKKLIVRERRAAEEEKTLKERQRRRLARVSRHNIKLNLVDAKFQILQGKLTNVRKLNKDGTDMLKKGETLEDGDEKAAGEDDDDSYSDDSRSSGSTVLQGGDDGFNNLAGVEAEASDLNSSKLTSNLDTSESDPHGPDEGGGGGGNGRGGDGRGGGIKHARRRGTEAPAATAVAGLGMSAGIAAIAEEEEDASEEKDDVDDDERTYVQAVTIIPGQPRKSHAEQLLELQRQQDRLVLPDRSTKYSNKYGGGAGLDAFLDDANFGVVDAVISGAERVGSALSSLYRGVAVASVAAGSHLSRGVSNMRQRSSVAPADVAQTTRNAIDVSAVVTTTTSSSRGGTGHSPSSYSPSPSGLNIEKPNVPHLSINTSTAGADAHNTIQHLPLSPSHKPTNINNNSSSSFNSPKAKSPSGPKSHSQSPMKSYAYVKPASAPTPTRLYRSVIRYAKHLRPDKVLYQILRLYRRYLHHQARLDKKYGAGTTRSEQIKADALNKLDDLKAEVASKEYHDNAVDLQEYEVPTKEFMRMAKRKRREFEKEIKLRTYKNATADDARRLEMVKIRQANFEEIVQARIDREQKAKDRSNMIKQYIDESRTMIEEHAHISSFDRLLIRFREFRQELRKKASDGLVKGNAQQQHLLPEYDPTENAAIVEELKRKRSDDLERTSNSRARARRLKYTFTQNAKDLEDEAWVVRSVDDLILAARAGDFTEVLDILFHPSDPVSPNKINEDGVTATYATLMMILKREVLDSASDLAMLYSSPWERAWKLLTGSAPPKPKLDLVLRLLLHAGGNVDFKKMDQGIDAYAVMHSACEQGALDVIDWLLSKGTDVNIRTKIALKTPLMMALEFDRMEVVLLLLKRGAMLSLELKDARGWRALHYAAVHARMDASSVLLRSGALTNVRNDANRLALEEARSRGRTEIAAMIQTYKSDVVDHLSRLDCLRQSTDIHMMEHEIKRQQAQAGLLRRPVTPADTLQSMGAHAGTAAGARLLQDRSNANANANATANGNTSGAGESTWSLLAAVDGVAAATSPTLLLEEQLLRAEQQSAAHSAHAGAAKSAHLLNQGANINDTATTNPTGEKRGLISKIEADRIAREEVQAAQASQRKVLARRMSSLIAESDPWNLAPITKPRPKALMKMSFYQPHTTSGTGSGNTKKGGGGKNKGGAGGRDTLSPLRIQTAGTATATGTGTGTPAPTTAATGASASPNRRPFSAGAGGGAGGAGLYSAKSTGTGSAGHNSSDYSIVEKLA